MSSVSNTLFLLSTTIFIVYKKSKVNKTTTTTTTTAEQDSYNAFKAELLDQRTKRYGGRNNETFPINRIS